MFNVRLFLHWSVTIIFISLLACAPVNTPSISASTPGPEKAKAKETVPKISLDRLPRAAAYYYFFLADLAQISGQEDLALKFLNTAKEIDTKSAFLEDELARYYIKRGDSGQALKHARLAVTKNPQYQPARMLLAGIFKALKRYDEAVTEYETILKQQPDNEDVLLRLGTLYLDLKRYEQAEGIMKRVVKLNPGSYMGLYYLGRIALLRQDLSGAVQYFKDSLTIDPGFEPAFNNLVFIYEKLGKVGQIEKIYKDLIRLKPSANQARLLMARYYLKIGQQEKAEALFKKLKTYPFRTADINLRIGLIYFEQKKYAKAINEFLVVLDTNPGNEQALYYMSLSYEELKEYQKAMDGFLKIRPDSGHYAESRFHIAFIFDELKKPKAGIPYLKEAIEKKPKESILYHSLAYLYEEDNQLEAARETAEKGLKINPDNLNLNFRLGVILDKLKDKEGSIKQMKKVIELDPEYADALNYLAYTWAEMRSNLDEALTLAERAIKIKPNAGYILDTIGWIYFQKNSYSSALKYLKRAVELIPDDPVINEHLGDTYFELEQFEKAFETYLKVQKLGPENKARLEKKIRDLKKAMRQTN